MLFNNGSVVGFLLRVYIGLLIEHSILFTEGKECILRRLGFCKVLDITTEDSSSKIFLSDFKYPPPDGFLLKTSIEINILENKFTFANNLLIEKNRRIEYDLDNAVLVTIQILMSNVPFIVENNSQNDVTTTLRSNATIMIDLGHKYYRLARFGLFSGHDKDRLLYEKKYNNYVPDLPKFPYNLHLQITKDGIFTIHADTNAEPFFTYQLDGNVKVDSLSIFGPDRQDDLVLFYDCTLENCGTHRVDELYDCKEWVDRERLLKKNYGKDVLFDECFFVDVEQTSKLRFFDSTQQSESEIEIVFRDKNIEAKLQHRNDSAVVAKTAFTKQRYEVPANPYAVRVTITNGTHNNFLNIANIRDDKIFSLSLCGKIRMLDRAELRGRKLYYDCVHPKNIEQIQIRRDEADRIKNRCDEIERNRTQYSGGGGWRGGGISYILLKSLVGRRRREIDECEGIKNDAYRFNFTKSLVDKRQYVSSPFVLYEHKFGNSLEDWCEGDPEPKVYDKLQTGGETLHSLIEVSSRGILSEFKKIGAQINATASNAESSFKAMLLEFKKLSSHIESQINKTAKLNTQIESNINTTAESNKAILSKLQVQINASTDANKAILQELQKISGQNATQSNSTDNILEAILAELRNKNVLAVSSNSYTNKNQYTEQNNENNRYADQNTEENTDKNTEENTEQNSKSIRYDDDIVI